MSDGWLTLAMASGAEPTPAPSPSAPAAGRRWRRAWGGAGRRPSVFPVHHQSNHQSKWLALLLNEIAQEVRDEVGPWATAFVIRSGSTCHGRRHNALVPERLWKGHGEDRILQGAAAPFRGMDSGSP